MDYEKRRAAHGSGMVREQLVETFLERSSAALERLSREAPADALEEALRAPTDVGGIASLLSDLAPLGQDVSALDPWAEELARGAVVKQELLRAAGGAFTPTEAGELLGITRQAVDQRIRRGTLLAVPQGNGERLLPACQFGEGGVVPGFKEALRAFRVEDPWMRLSLLLDTDRALTGRTVLEALRDGDVEAAVRAVRGFGEHGAA